MKRMLMVLTSVICFVCMAIKAEYVNSFTDNVGVTWKLAAPTGWDGGVFDPLSDSWTTPPYPPSAIITGANVPSAEAEHLVIPQRAVWYTHGDGIYNTFGSPLVTTIRYSAFQDYDALKMVSIPYTVTTIGTPCFRGCSNLSAIKITNGGNKYTELEVAEGSALAYYSSYITVDGVLYNKTKTKLLKYPEGKEGDFFVVPVSVTNLAPYCFANTKLKAVQFLGDCPELDSTIFSGSSCLVYRYSESDGWTAGTHWDWIAGTYLSGSYVFDFPRNGRKDESGNTINYEIVDGCLYCYAVKNEEVEILAVPSHIGGVVAIPATLGGNPVTSIGENAFAGCYALTDVTIPNSVTNIGDYAFGHSFELTHVAIGNSVMRIGDRAFGSCYALESVTGLRDDMDVAATAFRGTPFDENRPFKLDVRNGILMGMQGICPAVLSVPDGVTAIDENAFSRWSYEIPDDGDPYSASWHSAVDALETVFVPASVEKIGLYAFGGCANLSRVEIANPDVMIDGGAFYECTGLASLGIQKSGFSLAGWNGVCYEPWEIREYDYERGDMVSITNFAEGAEIRMGPSIDFMVEGFTLSGNTGEINEDYGLFWFTAVWEMVAALPEVAVDAAPDAVTNAIESAGFADAAEVKRAIGGSAEKYAAFKEWAQRVKHPGGSSSSATVAGEAAVVANTNAAAAFMLGAERLFEKAPVIEIGEVAIGGKGTQATETKGTMTVSVVVKDGEEAVRCTAEKVKEMFEATSDLGDWNGASKMTPTVAVEDGDGATMRFKVTPGDGTASRAFLRIRK